MPASANSSLFKPSVMQPLSQTTYDLKSELLVCYSSHYLNNKPFDERTILDHLNTELVGYSDPHGKPFETPSQVLISYQERIWLIRSNFFSRAKDPFTPAL